MVAIIQAHRDALLRRAHWLPNAVSGLVVGVIALPLAMAFAIASGARPEQGLYTSVLAGLLMAMLGGSRFQVAGPTGAFIVILAGITAQFGIVGLQVATMMAGAMLLFLGMLGAGSLLRYVPQSVIAGFTAGIAVIVFVGQWAAFLGYQKVSQSAFHEKVWALLVQWLNTHWDSFSVGVFSLAVLLISSKRWVNRRFKRVPQWLFKVPAPLWAIGLATLLLMGMQAAGLSAGVATIASAFGGISQGLPEFSVPDVTAQPLKLLILPALSIALLCAIESVLCCAVADCMAKLPPVQQHKPK